MTVYNGISCDYLHSFGINPNRIPDKRWHEDGYFEFPGDDPFGDSTRRPVFHPWPEGFDYQRLLAAYVDDEPSRRRGADVTVWKPKDVE